MANTDTLFALVEVYDVIQGEKKERKELEERFLIRYSAKDYPNQLELLKKIESALKEYAKFKISAEVNIAFDGTLFVGRFFESQMKFIRDLNVKKMNTIIVELITHKKS